jgi:hypothetical protein
LRHPFKTVKRSKQQGWLQIRTIKKGSGPLVSLSWPTTLGSISIQLLKIRSLLHDGEVGMLEKLLSNKNLF